MNYPPMRSNGFIVADAEFVAVVALASAETSYASAEVTKAVISEPSIS
jgi:hypothetical protein